MDKAQNQTSDLLVDTLPDHVWAHDLSFSDHHAKRVISDALTLLCADVKTLSKISASNHAKMGICHGFYVNLNSTQDASSATGSMEALMVHSQMREN